MTLRNLFLTAVATLLCTTALHAAEALTQNTKAYTFKTQRGVLGTQDGYLTCTVNTSFKNQGKFAVISYEGKTYLYSVADKKFTCRETSAYDTRNGGWHNVLLSNNPIEPISIAEGNKFADYPYAITSEGRTFNTYVNTQKGVCLSGWMTYDAGNQFAVEAPVDFDPTEAVATLDAFFHSGIEVTYRVTDVDGHFLEEQTMSGMAGEVISAVPTSFVRHAFTLYSVKSPVTVTSAGDNVVEVEAVFQMPFTTSPDISDAHWYNLTLRSGEEFVNAAAGYKCNPSPTAEQLLSNEYQWAFQGDPYDGIVLYNRSDVSKTLCKSGDVAVLGEGIYKWTLVEHTNGFLLANAEDGKFINEYRGSGGHLAFWNNADDVNSIFTVNEVGIVTSVKLPSSAKARLNLYPAPAQTAKDCAMLIIPGGGYSYVAGSTEGSDWAPMLGELGYTSAVLTYTTPPHIPRRPDERCPGSIALHARERTGTGHQHRQDRYHGLQRRRPPGQHHCHSRVCRRPSCLPGAVLSRHHDGCQLHPSGLARQPPGQQPVAGPHRPLQQRETSDRSHTSRLHLLGHRRPHRAASQQRELRCRTGGRRSACTHVAPERGQPRLWLQD